jgi:hypothetical protein
LKDIFIYSLCVLGILFFLNLFRLDLYRTLTRQTEQPIAVITFKYKVAQRRFVDRVLWDRLKQESPVYDGDFIRTAEISEATVTFAGGRSTIINLEENSLIQLHEEDGGIRIDISEGGLSADAGDSTLVLVSGARRIRVETGGAVQAGIEEGELKLRVMEGTASFSDPGGTGSLSAGEGIVLGDAGPRSLLEAVALFPRPQARFLNPGPGRFTVAFRWSHPNPEAATRLEIAEDRAFSRLVFSGDFDGDRAAVDLEGGSYFWRVSPANDEEPFPTTLAFKILPAPTPVLISPAEGYRYQFRTSRPSVRFHWTETEEAAFYVLEAADNPDMANPALSREVRGTSLYASALGAGTWYWRVRPVFPAAFQGAAAEGVPVSFSIVQSGSLKAPELRVPQDQGTVNVAAELGAVYFSWWPEAEARSYRILISEDRDLGNPVLDETVRDNFYVYQAGQNTIRPGRYYWAVSQTDAAGNVSARSPVYSFTTLEGEAIQTPLVPLPPELPEPPIPPATPPAPPQPPVQAPVAREAPVPELPTPRTTPPILPAAPPIPPEPPAQATVVTAGEAPVPEPPAPAPEPPIPPASPPIPPELPAQDTVVTAGEDLPALPGVAQGEDQKAPAPPAPPAQAPVTTAGDAPAPELPIPPIIPPVQAAVTAPVPELPIPPIPPPVPPQLPAQAVVQDRADAYAIPLTAPLLLEPAPGSRMLIQAGKPLVFSWTASEGAEYYQFTLYRGTDPDKAVYENSRVAGTSLSMDSHPDGDYRWTLRGLAPERPGVPQRTGPASEGVFSLITLHPVSLDYPGDNAGIEGLRAYYEPETLRWSSTVPVETSTFILSTNSDLTGPPLALINNPPHGITLPRLREGNYYWTIRAETPEGFDISAAAPRQFRVLPIPLLPAAANRLPESGKLIGGAELRAKRRIVFSWDAVMGATGYLFTLKNADTGNAVMRRTMTETALALEDLTLLDVGTFTWHLEAIVVEPALPAGEIIQHGETGENRFTIDIGLPGPPELRRPGTLYGTVEADERFTQRLTWNEQENALYYKVEIEKQTGTVWERAVSGEAERSSFEVSRSPGIYRYRVRPYDLLGRPGPASDWLQFEIILAQQPELLRFSPQAFYLEEDDTWVISIFGRNLVEGIEFFLQGSQGRFIKPTELRVEPSGTEARLSFRYEQLDSGDYSIHAMNPGGLWAELQTFRIVPYRPLDITASAGYRPLLSLYGGINEVFETPLFPLGAYSRLSIIPFKRRWGYMGLEFEPSWNYLLVRRENFEVQAQMPGAMIYWVYQYWFPNRAMTLDFRIGGGMYAALDYHVAFARGKTDPITVLFPAAAAGLSFRWYVKNPFFVEAGVDFTHFFTVDDPSPAYLRPFIGVGWKF